MRFAAWIVSGATLAGMMLGTGCATKKYVNLKVAPVETRVGATEKKNGDQDTAIAANKTAIDEVDRDLSRTKERVNDVDTKVQAASTAAQKADQKAGEAAQAAENARSFAEKSAGELRGEMRKSIDGLSTYRLVKEASVQFALNATTLSDEAKAALDDLSKSLSGLNSYVVELQGFTDKSGSPAYNFRLSQSRAESVARYLAVTYKVPLRYIHMLGEGSLVEVADNHTRAGRKQNRRVDIKVWVPETEAAKNLTATQ